MFRYLIEATIVLSTFYLIYIYVFNKYLYFEWNRFFLISIVVISVILPLIKIDWITTSSLKFNPNDILFVNLDDEQFFVKTSQKQFFFSTVYLKFSQNKYFTIFNLLIVIYISGILRQTIVFINNLISIKKLEKSSIKSENKKHQIYLTNSKITAFSFFEKIFVNKNYENLKTAEQQQIIEHENIHVKQKHTLDNLFFEIVNIFFWFNPFIKKLKKSVKENHEFIVDKILTKQDSRYNYSFLMVKLVAKKSVPIINNFSDSKVKSRIKLLSNPEKERIKKIRFVSTIPILLLLIFTFLFTLNIVNNSFNTKAIKTNKFIFPIENNYTIAGYYIETQTITDKANKNIKYKISHKKITIQTENFTKVLAIGNGKILTIDTINDWGLNEIKITIKLKNNYKVIYEKLAEVLVTENQKVKTGQTIGKTGDKRLYPTIDYQLLLNEKAINPLEN